MNSKQMIWRVCYAEGEDTADANPITETADATKTFTQEDVNKFLAGEKRKWQSKNEELATQLREFKQKSSTSVEDREVLQARIDQLENEYLSKEEKARRESDKQKKQYTEQVDGLTQERDAWQQRYTSQLIQTSIVNAASREETRAFDPGDIIAHLAPMTALVEVEEDGEKTGAFVPKVAFPDTNKDGQAVSMSFTVDEAVKRMTELDRYKHLFVATAKGGAGASGSNVSSKGGKVDLVELAKDPAAYRKWRAEQGMSRLTRV